MRLPVLLLLALCAGAVLPFQAAVNAQLKAALGGPLPAALVSFLAGSALLLGTLWVTRTPLAANAGAVAWWQWGLGGLLGSAYMILIIWLTPLLGVALTFGLIVAGQMLMALVLDHLGLLGVPVHAVNLPRLAGAALVIAGVVMIRRY